VCGFEQSSTPYCGLWNNVKGDQFDWTRKSGKTPSSGTGPTNAAEGSNYLYIECSGSRKTGDKAILESNKVTLGSGADLEFDFHMYGSQMGTLEVFVDMESVWKMSGNKGNKWEAAAINLDRFSGKEVQIQIVATKGRGWSSDIAIDDIILIPGAAGPAPRPRPTPRPTPAPTPAPTLPPTAPPTNPPTAAPTQPPTQAPTQQPPAGATPTEKELLQKIANLEAQMAEVLKLLNQLTR
jgi:hypothetical protein